MSKKSKDETLATAIREARKVEKQALLEARQQASILVRQQTEAEHQAVLEAVREAIIAGYSVRQIGLAYGSTDPYTAKRLVLEATGDNSKNFTQALEQHPEWFVSNNPDGTFGIKVVNFGEQKMSGEGIFKVDEDQENFTQVSGDSFIQIQMYKLGLVDKVLQEVNGE